VPLDVIERALEDVSDGNPVDWNLLDSAARDEGEREQLKWLRVLDQMVGLHRSVNDSIDEDSIGPDLVRRPAQRSANVESATWGRYELLEKIGEGSFGSVHCAWDPQLESELAIKILHPVATDERLKARLLREGRALAKVSHPNIVKVLNVEAHEGRIGLCMEFVRGQTLDELVRAQGTLSVDDALAVGRDVSAALAAVHGAGFLHRDIKARNVLRELAGRIVLMDFGAGREAEVEVSARRPDMTGTPLYMAPELLAGTPASSRSDVYSVGVLLYHLVTGEYPVQAQTVDALRTAHRAGNRRSLRERRPNLPKPFVRVVDQALAADPRDRYADGGALLAAFETVVRSRTRKSIASRLLTLAYGVAAGGVSLIALGALSSVAFNQFLGRSAFASESALDSFSWGLKSSLLPAYLLIWTAVVASVVVALRRLAIGRSSVAARLEQNAQRFIDGWILKGSLNPGSASPALVLAFSAGALVCGWWYFWWLISVFPGTASSSPAALLAVFAPVHAPDHDFYRAVFSCVVLLSCLSWYAVLKLARRQGQRVNSNLLAGGIAVMVLALATVDAPYRLFRHNGFEAAKWQGQMCYIIGERATDLLLFCPELQPPRNRVVRKDTQIERLGVFENIFTRFSPATADGIWDRRPQRLRRRKSGGLHESTSACLGLVHLFLSAGTVAGSCRDHRMDRSDERPRAIPRVQLGMAARLLRGARPDVTRR
jgi:serine/threonine protein kinase